MLLLSQRFVYQHLEREMTRIVIPVGLLVVFAVATTLAVDGPKNGADAPLSILSSRIGSDTETCFAYEASRQSHEQAIRVDVHYRIGNPNHISDPKVTVAVRGPAMVKTLDEALVPSGHTESFHFQAMMSGMHRICFLLQRGTYVSLELEIQGSNDQKVREKNTIDADVQFASGTIEEYSNLLADIQDRVTMVTDDLAVLDGHREEFERTVMSTYIRLVTFTIINLVVVVASIGWQVLSLKSFFKAKKIV